MDCNEANKLSHSYLDGEIVGSQASSMEAHLERCPLCKSEVEGLKRTLAVLKSLPEIEIPADFLVRIHQKLEDSPGMLAKIKNYLLSPKLRYAAAFTMSIFILSMAVFSHYRDGFGIQLPSDGDMMASTVIDDTKEEVIETAAIDTSKFRPPSRLPTEMTGSPAGVFDTGSTTPLGYDRVSTYRAPSKPASTAARTKSMFKLYTLPNKPDGEPIDKMPDITIAVIGPNASGIGPHILTLASLGGGELITNNSNVILLNMPTAKVDWMAMNLEKFGSVEATQGIGEGPRGEWALMQILLIPTTR